MYNTDMPNRADLPTTAQLIRSTLIAAATAAVLLVTVVLPAEYAIDPTGLGRALGLTQMGEIKQQLASEADAAERGTESAEETPAPVPERAMAEMSSPTIAQPAETAQPEWRDTVTLTLAPGEAAEIKLMMNKGDTATYQWSVSGGHVNSDLHGDGSGGISTSYRKGRAEAGNTGELHAAFDGAHGWFWRNRSEVEVAVILKVCGEYAAMKRVL